MTWTKGAYSTGQRRTRTREEHQLYMRQWRRTPKAVAWRREHEKKHEVREYRKHYRQIVARTEKFKNQRKAYKKRYRQNPANRAKEQTYRRKLYAKHFPPAPVIPEFYPFLTGQERDNDLLLAIHSIVPALPEDLRREVCQDSALMILSGACSLRELPNRMSEIIHKAKKRNWNPYGTIYLGSERYPEKAWSETL